MAQRQDKINSWQDVYKEINRIINLPATGAATSFTDASTLNVEDVQRASTVDDLDVQNLIERYEVLKNDALYGSSSQLNTSHVSSTVNLYNTILDPVTDRSIIEASTDTNAQSIKYNMSRIQCRNIVYCTNSYYSPCGKQNYSCNERHYSSCTESFTCSCDSAYTCNKCNSNYRLDCGRYINYYICTVNRPCNNTCTYDTPNGDYCGRTCNGNGCYRVDAYCGANYVGCTSNYVYAGCGANTSSCGTQCASDVCRQYVCSTRECHQCSAANCSNCLSQLIETPCSRGTHNDILCSNTY